MIFNVTAGIIMTCNLINFNGLPSKIQGELVMETAKFYVLRLENKDKSQAIEITVSRGSCEAKK